MIDHRAAVIILQRELDREFEPGKYKVFAEISRDKPWGWVMFYGSEADYYTAGPIEASASHPAYLVNRVTGEFQQAGKSWPVEKYVEDYETQLQSLAQRTRL